MYKISHWKGALALCLLVSSTSLFAVTPEDEEDKKCIKPKFRDFSPAAKAEVNPGSEISFHVTHNADPASIGAEAKTIKMKLTVRDRKTFYEAHAALPEELSNSYARISIHAKAAEGECVGHDGWLIKVNPKAGEVAAPAEAH